MSGIPDDLRPLPTMPFEKRPSELPLDVEECRTAIWRTSGNLSRAAELLKVPPARFRAFVARSPRLQREVDEAAEQIIDAAEDVVREALADPDRADAMARFVLGSSKARKRGWGNGAQTNVNINTGDNNLIFQWAGGEVLTAPPEKPAPTIEGEYEEVSDAS